MTSNIYIHTNNTKECLVNGATLISQLGNFDHYLFSSFSSRVISLKLLEAPGRFKRKYISIQVGNDEFSCEAIPIFDENDVKEIDFDVNHGTQLEIDAIPSLCMISVKIFSIASLISRLENIFLVIPKTYSSKISWILGP